MEGHLSLMGIRLPGRGIRSSKDGSQLYSGVKATFCHIAWRLQDQDPSKVPMFSDLRDQSPLCIGTRFTVDLWEVSRKAQSYDWRNHTFAATKPAPGQGPVPPTAVVFHQTRCGSTLIANVLAAFMPQHTRVYSEANALIAALKACEFDAPCDPGAQDALVQDVFYMMGRSPGPTLPQYVFYKIQSTGAHAMDVFTRAMPHVPWIFAYRDPVEIIMSHFKNYQTGNPLGADFMPNCLRTYGKRAQHPLLVQTVQSQGRTIPSLTKEEYCAAHLASLGQAAVIEYEKGGNNEQQKRWFVNYNELPYKIWEHILPKLVPFVSHDQVERMHEQGKVYSKGRGEKGGQHWHEDSTMKQGTAPESVKKAAALFMNPVYEKMEEYRKEGENN